MEPVQKPPTKDFTPPPASATPARTPIPSLARATMSDMQTDRERIVQTVTTAPSGMFAGVESFLMSTGWLKAPPKGWIPTGVFLKLPAKEMLNHLECLTDLKHGDLLSLDFDRLSALLPYLDKKTFHAVVVPFVRVLHHSTQNNFDEITNFPLEYQIAIYTLMSGTNSVRNNIKNSIINTLLRYIQKNQPFELDDEGKRIIQRMVDQDVFAGMSREQAKLLPRSIWEAIIAYAPTRYGETAIVEISMSEKLGPALAAMPLDLLEKFIPVFEVYLRDKEILDDILKQIEQLPPEQARQYQNIIAFSERWYDQLKKDKPVFLEKLKVDRDLPPLPMQILQRIDDYFQNKASLDGIESELSPEWLKFFEDLNRKIAVTGVVDEKWSFYETYKQRQLQLFIKLVEKMHASMDEEGIVREIPKEQRLIWECTHLNTFIRHLLPITLDKQRAFQVFLSEIDVIPRFNLFPRDRIITKEMWQLLKETGELSTIDTILCRKRQLRVVPPEIGDLINLQEINFSDNVLTSLPSEIGNLKNLFHLNLRNNTITSLPLEFANLTELNSLLLGSNSLRAFPQQILSCPYIQTLDVSNNAIEELPENIDIFSRLMFLHIESNQIRKLPAKLVNLRELVTLNASNNFISEIPEGFTSLTKLRGIFLSYNMLSKIPADIGNLQVVYILSLDNNQISEIPQSVGNLLELMKLSLHNNRLSSLPDVDKLSKLELLSLNGNQLYELRARLSPAIKELNLRGNFLTAIPECVFGLPVLEKLDLSENQIVKVDLNFQKLRAKTVSLAFNNLTVFNEILPANLAVLDLSNNQLRAFPALLLTPATPITVDISKNSIPPFTLPPGSRTTIKGQNDQQFVGGKL